MHNFDLNTINSNENIEMSISGNDEIGSSNVSTNNNMEVIFLGQNSNNNRSMESSNIAATINRDTATNNRFPKQYNNSCKTLQRKLELKVERAKKNYSQQNGSEMVNDTKSNTSLIPINRLPIPSRCNQLPLVEYKSDHSDSEDEEFSSPFFPTKTKTIKKLDLSDTFSIQEMTIETDSDGESGDSQNLELLPPSVRIKFIDKVINYLCCSSP